MLKPGCVLRDGDTIRYLGDQIDTGDYKVRWYKPWNSFVIDLEDLPLALDELILKDSIVVTD